MDKHVIDTHAFIWYLANSPKLSATTNKIFQEIERGDSLAIIPSIVLAEIVFIAEKKKIKVTLGQALEKIETSQNFLVSPLGVKEIKVLETLNQIPEMHDRIVIATAQIHQAKLISKDRTFREKIKALKVIW